MTGTDPVTVADVARRLVERLRDGRLPSSLVADDPGVWDDVREHQQRIKQQAWTRGLVEASHGDYATWTIADLDEDQQPRTLARFVDELSKPDRKILNLIITGTVGGGKTVAAIATGAAAINRGLLTQFVQHGTYLGWLRPEGQPSGMSAGEVFDRYVAADLLILDDLGADVDKTRPATGFVQDMTNDLIGARVADGRPTVVTTNLTSSEVRTVYGQRVLSRLGTRACVVELRAKDRRKPVSWG